MNSEKLPQKTKVFKKNIFPLVFKLLEDNWKYTKTYDSSIVQEKQYHSGNTGAVHKS